MKISEFPKVTEFSEDSMVLTDGSAGTKTALVKEFVFKALDLVGPEAHKALFRGKNLGGSFTAEQKSAVQNGSFKDLWIGDYWTINEIVWRIADIDYWYGYGDTKFMQHHLVVIPDEVLYKAAMNPTNDVSSGYNGSAMHTTNLSNAKTIIKNAFKENVLTRRELLSNAGVGGRPSNAAWFDSSVEVPDTRMIMGRRYDFAGETDPIVYQLCSGQLALFSASPRFIPSKERYWTRDITNSSGYAYVHPDGNLSMNSADSQNGVRPVFALG